MKKTLTLSILVLQLMAAALLSGCGFKDIDKRYFVVAMGIDMTDNEENPYRITLKLGVPSLQIDVGKSKTQVETIDTPTIAEGIRMLKAHVDKEIDFGHCNVFLLGEQLAHQNVREAVQWMSRRRDIQNIAAIGIGSPSAEEIMKVQPTIERFPGNMLVLFFSEDATESSYTFVELLSDFARRLNEKGLDPILPIVTVNHEDKTYIIDRLALLNKEKVILTLDQHDTQLLHQLTSHLNNADMYGAFSSPPFVISINSIKTKYNIEMKDAAPQVNLHIKQAASMEQMPIGSYFNETKKTVDQLESAYSEEITALLQKIQESGVDPYGFGLRYRAKYHLVNFDQEWPEIYKNMTFNVQTKIDVRGTGLLR